MEIHRSARKHGIDDAAITNAVEQALVVVDLIPTRHGCWRSDRTTLATSSRVSAGRFAAPGGSGGGRRRWSPWLGCVRAGLHRHALCERHRHGSRWRAILSGVRLVWYVDTSAVVKLVVAERESASLRSWLLEAGRELVACDRVRADSFEWFDGQRRS